MRFHFLISALVAAAFLGGCGAPRYVKPSTVITTPPSGKALINVHWWHGKPKNAGWPLFTESGQLAGMLRSHTLNQIVVDPGTHILLGRAGIRDYTAAVQVSTESNRVYDIIGDWETAWSDATAYLNWGSAGVRIFLNPVPAQGDLRKALMEEESDQSPVLLDRSDPDVAKIEREYAEDNKLVLSEFLTGKLKDKLQVLTADQYRR